MKKMMLYLLGGFFALQLAVLGSQVYLHYDTLTTGEQFRFEVAPYDPYDPFRGRYVALRVTQNLYQNDLPYQILARDERGFAYVTGWEDSVPQDVPYAKNLRLERYYMNEQQAPEAERISRELKPEDELALLVRVKKGRFVIEGLELNGLPIEQQLIAR